MKSKIIELDFSIGKPMTIKFSDGSFVYLSSSSFLEEVIKNELQNNLNKII